MCLESRDLVSFWKCIIIGYVGNGAKLRQLQWKLYVAYRMTLLPVTYCGFEGHFCCVHFHWHISTLVPKRHDSVFNNSVKDGDILTDIARRAVPLQ